MERIHSRYYANWNVELVVGQCLQYKIKMNKIVIEWACASINLGVSHLENNIVIETHDSSIKLNEA
jgi:hypothetical protein